jgi:hypothetical protein
MADDTHRPSSADRMIPGAREGSADGTGPRRRQMKTAQLAGRIGDNDHVLGREVPASAPGWARRRRVCDDVRLPQSMEWTWTQKGLSNGRAAGCPAPSANY